MDFSSVFNDEIKIVSFDIFDTILTRLWARPEDLFVKLEENLFKYNSSWKNFAFERIQAELEARRSKEFSKEVTLEEIYNWLRKRMDLDQSS